jgi:hypothetical protein
VCGQHEIRCPRWRMKANYMSSFTCVFLCTSCSIKMYC